MIIFFTHASVAYIGFGDAKGGDHWQELLFKAYSRQCESIFVGFYLKLSKEISRRTKDRQLPPPSLNPLLSHIAQTPPIDDIYFILSKLAFLSLDKIYHLFDVIKYIFCTFRVITIIIECYFCPDKKL